MTTRRIRRGLLRPRYVAVTDTRSPMRRLLEDCNNKQSGEIEISWERQYQTLWKAQRLGYVDQGYRLTSLGGLIRNTGSDRAPRWTLAEKKE